MRDSSTAFFTREVLMGENLPIALTIAGSDSGGGAGIQAGQFASSLGVSAVITGAVGPNASRVLSASGLKVYTGASGTVQQAVDAFNGGKLTSSASATVGAHNGMR